MDIKNYARSVLNFLHLDLTKNLQYDRLTKAIMQKVIKPDSNCIDIGCHKGEILDSILRIAPQGRHFAFEPLPHLYVKLKERYQGKAEVLPYALSDYNGDSSFQYVRAAPAYSGIKKREYLTENPDIEVIDVELRTLDEIIPDDLPIDFIKIDVEGAEYGVLKGGMSLLKKYQPTIVFEFGLGASDYYGTTPEKLYTFLTSEIGLKVGLLQTFLDNDPPLSLERFEEIFQEGIDYYFVAYP